MDTTNLFGLQKTLPILLIVQENLLMRWMHIFLLSAGGGEKRELCKHEEMVQVKVPMARVDFFHFSDLVVECVLIIFLKT